MNQYDVIVIGAGPAGSTAAALMARAGQRVLLLEKSFFPRHKLCGEFITPECGKVFDRLGVSEKMYDAGAQIIRKWTLHSPEGRSLEVPMEWIADGHSHAIGLSRARMDLILLECAAEAGADVRQGFQVSSNFQSDHGIGVVEGKNESGEKVVFRAPVILDASGRTGVFAKSTLHDDELSRFHGSRLFGCKVHLRSIEGMKGIGELFFFGDGYGGLSDVEGEKTNLCFLTTEATLMEAKGDREKLLDLTMRSNPAGSARLKNAVIDGEWLGTGPLKYGRRRRMPGVISIGDAGAFIDPFTGSGMLLAFTSGEIAADVINRSFAEGVRDIEEISERYESIFRSTFGLRFRACSMLRSLAFRPATRNFMVSLLSRHKSLMKIVALSTRQNWQSLAD